MTPDEIARLIAENAALKAKIAGNTGGKLRAKVSEKGAVSVYGLGRWPVTLYATQWAALIAAVPMVQEFIKDNADKLATKPMTDKEPAPAETETAAPATAPVSGLVKAADAAKANGASAA